jgi:hypothetical protein
MPVDVEKFAECRLNRSHGIAQFLEPVAPELLDRRYVVGLTDLAQDVSPQRGKVKAAQHRAADIREIDPVVDIDTEQILAERAFPPSLPVKDTRSWNVMAPERTLASFVICSSVVAVVGAFTPMGGVVSCSRTCAGPDMPAQRSLAS